jgi:hypothetical protein
MEPWIQTHERQHFEPFNPDPDKLRLADIARALSHQCRYTGHTERFYSVAEHSVHVSRVCEMQFGRLDLARYGLMHDASEAYLTDVAAPIKRSLAFEWYREVETRIMQAVCNRFKLPIAEPREVKQADEFMLAFEAHRLLPGGPLPEWPIPRVVWRWGTLDEVPTLGLLPDAARDLFLARAAELGIE